MTCRKEEVWGGFKSSINVSFCQTIKQDTFFYERRSALPARPPVILDHIVDSVAPHRGRWRVRLLICHIGFKSKVESFNRSTPGKVARHTGHQAGTGGARIQNLTPRETASTSFDISHWFRIQSQIFQPLAQTKILAPLRFLRTINVQWRSTFNTELGRCIAQ